MKEKIVDIFDMSYEGAGVGKIDGKVIFVPKTLIGERAKCVIEKETNSFAIGKVEEILTSSDKRIVPKCPYFDICGGCEFQHCSQESEKEIKLSILKRELQKVGYNGDIDFVESDKRFGYRNKIKLEVCGNKLGFFKSKSHDFFAVEKCVIADDQINDALPKIETFLKENDFKNLKNVYVRCIDKKVAICFLFDKNAQKTQKNAKKIEILSDFDVFFAFGDILESNKTQIKNIFGDIFQTKDYGDFVAKYDISAFCQINDFVAQKMYELVLENTNNKRVINAYSGQGVLTYLISKGAKFVYGIEYQKTAHEKAEELKNLSSEYKIENICGRVEDEISKVLQRDKIDAIVLDPAREGCQKSVLSAINENKIDEVLYISCNFSTLVRDLKILNDFYEILQVKIFNMFPCTANLETFVKLRRKTDF